MTTKIPKADTYLVAHENAIYCKRCGTKQSFTLPTSVDAWVNLVAVFNKQHAKCPKPGEENHA
jgi:hypothetical protein